MELVVERGLGNVAKRILVRCREVWNFLLQLRQSIGERVGILQDRCDLVELCSGVVVQARLFRGGPCRV